MTLVSKDINLRIKAAIVGVHAEDYYSDRTIEDADLLYTGVTALPADFWEQHSRDMRSWKEAGRTWYEISGPAVADWQRQPVRVREHRAGHRGHRAQDERRHRDARAGARLPQRAPRGLGHHRAQPRAELRPEPAAGPGDRLRHHARAGRHRQDAADAGRRADADARDQPLRRNHHDARDDSARRGHRLPARHRGGEDGAVDGRADGQPRGADAAAPRAATGVARPPTTCCATASRSARSTSCAAAPS